MLPLRDNIPSSRPPIVNYLIIATCVGVFFWQAESPDLHVEWAFHPRALLHPEIQPLGLTLGTILTSMFMHGGLLHLLGNMLFLWIFGDNVEDRMGHFRFLIFYLLCGALAALTHALISGFAPLPVLGASGAIAGVLGAYFVLFPGASVRTLVVLFVVLTVIDLPALVFLGLWFLYQLLLGLGTLGAVGGGGVAFWAHIGGFVAGMGLVRRFVIVRRRPPPPPRVLDIRYD